MYTYSKIILGLLLFFIFGGKGIAYTKQDVPLSSQEIYGIKSHNDSIDDEYRRAERLVDQGQKEEASKIANGLLSRHPYSLWAWRVTLIINSIKKSNETVDDVINKQSVDYGATGSICFARAYSEYLNSNFTLSKNIISGCESTVKDHVLAKNLHATLTGALGNTDDAIKQLKPIIAKNHDLILVQNNLKHQIINLMLKRMGEIFEKPEAVQKKLWKNLRMQATELEKNFPSVGLHILMDAIHSSNRMRAFASIVVQVGNAADFAILRSGEAEPSLWFSIHESSRFDNNDIDLRFAPKAAVLQYGVSTGTHHRKSVMIVVPERTTPAVSVHEWQYTDPLKAVDLDGDGFPELIEDRSDYYVNSFAAGIVNFNFYIKSYDQETGLFRYRLLGLPEKILPEEIMRLTADGLEHAARGRWNQAAKSFKKTFQAESFSNQLRWNFIIAQLHATNFEKQYKNNPNPTTALLNGNIDELLRKKIPLHKFLSNSLPLVNLFQMAIDYPDSAVGSIKFHLYQQNRTANQMNEHSSDFFDDSNKTVIVPEARAYEHALISYRRGSLFYAEPKQKPNQYIAWLDSKESPSDYVFSPSKELRDPKINRDFSSLSYLVSRSNTDERALLNSIHLEDFGKADKILGAIENSQKGNLEKNYLNHLRRHIDINLGRSHRVLGAIQSLTQFTSNEVEVYEKLGLFAVAAHRYQELIADCTHMIESNSVNDCRSSFIGLGRSLLKSARYKDAIKAFGHAEALMNNNELSYEFEYYAEFLSLQSRARTRTGELQMARALNALAHFALVRSIDPGSSQIQSSFYYRHPMLARILLTDFEVARMAGQPNKAVAYLSASLSVVRDLALAAEDQSSRFSIAQAEYEILRAAAQYLCESNRPLDALVAINQLRDVSATQLAIQSLQSSSNKISQPITTSAIQKKLENLANSKTALIQYVVTESAIFAVVANPTVNIVKLEITEPHLREKTVALVEHLAGLDSSDREAEARDYLMLLHNELISPLTKYLLDAKNLVIIPDDVLYRLPFAALMDKQGKHLVENFSIAYASSIQSMIIGQPPPLKIKKVLVAHSPETVTLPALQSGKDEATAIRSGLGNATVIELQGRQLDRTSIVRETRSVDLIHLSTHAYVDTTAPEHSFVMLNEPAGDVGFLKVEHFLSGEVLWSNRPIVVLAACSSGSGQLFQEGLLGFGYGLSAAGASATIMSFWEIEDKSGLKFSQYFYESLGYGADPALAVAQAQRNLIGKLTIGEWAGFFMQRAY